jgi:Spy/CpxP family protein refolding chaperone
MTPFLSGALGALVVLFVVATVRRFAWMHRFRRLHGRSMPLRFLYRRLRTRPEQEQVISAEAEALSTEVRALRAELRTVRDEVADLVAGPAVDTAAVQAAIDARIARLAALRTRLSEGLARIHATLEPAQRELLAAMIRNGPHGHHGRRFAHGRC